MELDINPLPLYTSFLPMDDIDPIPIRESSTPFLFYHCVCGSKIHAYSAYYIVPENFDPQTLTESLRSNRPLPYPYAWYVYRKVAAIVNIPDLQAFDQIHYSTTSDHQPEHHVAITQEDLDRYTSHGLTKKQIYMHLTLYKYHEEEEESEVCAVCLAGYEKDVLIAMLPCKHRFHLECIREWLLRKNVCPLCKRPAVYI